MFLHAIVLAGAALELLAAAFFLGGVGWLLIWPAWAFFAVAVAYATERPFVFAKDAHRVSRAIARFGLLPYLALANLLWHLLRLREKEPPWVWLTPEICIGRRLLTNEYPSGVASIVDLTCEFLEQLPKTAGIHYCALPLLDAAAVRPSRLRAIVCQVAELPRPVFLHCAQGHGRTALVAASLLLHIGAAANASDAEEQVLRARPGAKMNRRQREALRWAAKTE